MIEQSNIPLDHLKLKSLLLKYLGETQGQEKTHYFDSMMNLIWNAIVLDMENQLEVTRIQSAGMLPISYFDTIPEAWDMGIELLRSKVEDLATAANYRKLTGAEVDEGISMAPLHTSKVVTNLDAFEFFDFYVKGEFAQDIKLRRLLGKSSTRTIKRFRSLVMVAKQKPLENILEESIVPNSSHLSKRMYEFARSSKEKWEHVKEILKEQGIHEDEYGKIHMRYCSGYPLCDIEYLLPRSSIVLGPIQKLKVAFSGGSRLSFGLGYTLILQRVLNVIGGAAMIGSSCVRAVSTYLTAQRIVEHQVREALSKYTSAKGMEVFSSLSDEAKREYHKEALLTAYALYDSKKPLTAEEIRQKAESFVHEATGNAYRFRFHVQDGLDILSNLGLVQDKEGTYALPNAKESITALEQAVISSMHHTADDLPLRLVATFQE